MTLCGAKHSFGQRARLRRTVAAGMALILALPVAGGWLAGLPPAAWLEFPPRQVYVHHAGFHWAACVALSLILAAALAPVVWRVARARAPAPSAQPPSARFPWWGWAAVCWTLAAWTLAWTRWPALGSLQFYTYTPLWLGFIAVLQALVQRRCGTCLLTRRPRALAGLFLLSAAFWWGFEWLNRSVENWFYQHVERFTPAAYAVMATLSFMTVLPAVLSVHDWLATQPRLTAGLGDWIRIRCACPRRTGCLFALAGAVGLLLMPAWPNLLFPLVWLAPLALLCGMLAAVGEPTLFDDLGHGDWRTLVRLALAALLCGWFWEMWNMYSLARWVYDVPFVGRFRIFEMPALGFAGYLPFGWECAAVTMALGLWRPERSLPHVVTCGSEQKPCHTKGKNAP